MGARDSLKTYVAKRNFKLTPEPAGDDAAGAGKALSFVVQKHAARNLHYDFRLELEGTLKSWAVPKGPSLDPTVKRMGVHVEDHPVSYASFEGSIPAKQYGAGDVIVWDRGLWTPIGDPVAGLRNGKLKFELHGEKLKGAWTLVRMHGRGDESHEPWLLIKEHDDHARPESEFDVLKERPDSVLTGKPLPGKTSSRTRTKKQRASPAIGEPEGVVKAKLPDTLSPQLATLTAHPPPASQASDWIYEIKFDGYRLLARIEGESVHCMTRNGNDWTSKLPKLAKALGKIGIASGWIDGEIVVLNDKGIPDFGALQNAFDSASTAEIVYYVFDLPYYKGFDLRQVSLGTRRQILQDALAARPHPGIRFSEAFDQPPQDLLESTRQLGLEGIIGKRKNSVYESRRSLDWIKLKTQLRQEFVIGGYTEPKGSRTGLGALLLGFHDAHGSLLYAGNVGTGFNEKTLRDLKARLSKIHSGASPFADIPRSVKGQWVKPTLIAEVAFGDWTHDKRIRHSVFQGLRTDKPAREITRETATEVAPVPKASAMPTIPDTKPAKAGKTSATKTETRTGTTVSPALKTLRITHPERVIDETTGFTKKNLVEHYARVAELMLPHLKGRPVSLVRAPNGIGGELFFQKHAEATSIPGIKLLDPSLDPGHEPLLEISSAAALLSAVQVNTVEFHTWNATARSINKPDRMSFDLDPGEGVSWTEVQEGTQLVHALLDELGLPCFLKTSGGKGLHVVVPLKRSFDFDTVKDFSRAIVDHLARVVPQRFVVKSGPKNRIGKIFVDYLRNGFGATTVAAWSVRARLGLGVSVPVAWDELPALTAGSHWTASTLGARLANGNRPWNAYESAATTLSAAMKKLEFKPQTQAGK